MLLLLSLLLRLLLHLFSCFKNEILKINNQKNYQISNFIKLIILGNFLFTYELIRKHWFYNHFLNKVCKNFYSLVLSIGLNRIAEKPILLHFSTFPYVRSAVQAAIVT